MKEKTPYEIVQDLNQELWDKYQNNDIWFSYTLENHIDSIAFNSFSGNYNLKIDLWNSESPQREWREKTNDYEPLEDTIKREFKLCIKELSKIKL